MATGVVNQSSLDVVLHNWADDGHDDNEKAQRIGLLNLLERRCSLRKDVNTKSNGAGSRLQQRLSGARTSLRRSLSIHGTRSASGSPGKREAGPSETFGTRDDSQHTLDEILDDLQVDLDPALLKELGVTSCAGLADIMQENPHLLEDRMGSETMSKIWFTFHDWNGMLTFDFPEGIQELPPLHFKGNVLVRGKIKHLSNLEVDGWLQVKDVEEVRNLKVGKAMKLAASPSLRKISNTVCNGELMVSLCSNLVSIDDDVLVREAITARDCFSLRTIPQRLDLSWNLDLKGCRALETLPPGLRIGGKLILKESTALKSIPEDLYVESSIGLRRCTSLTKLPENFHCRCHLDLHQCTSLTELPKNLQVGGWANFSETGISSLPNCLRVGLNLRVDSTLLETIPSEIQVGGYIQARDCPHLAYIPSGLHVHGALELQNCPSLLSLPAGLVVDGALNLRECTGITELPDDLIVRQSVNLEGCTNLRTLPNALLDYEVQQQQQQVTLRPYATHARSRSFSLDEPARVFYLSGSGVTPEEVARLREVCTGNIRFDFSMRHLASSEEFFPTLNAGIAFWFELAKVPKSKRFDPMVHVPAMFQRSMLLFLSKLRWSAEFRKSSFQEALANRVVDAFDLLVRDDFSRDEVLTRISDSVDACADKPIWALNQITLISKLAHARGHRDEVRALGKGVMRLEVVHEHVRRKIASLKAVDDVCVFLRYEIELRDSLDLPVSAADMLFPIFIRVTPEELEACRDEALGISEESFELWLQDWPEWQRQLRYEAAEALTYKQLPRNSKRFSMSWTDLFGNSDLMDPVRIERGGPVWSMSDLLQHWIATGLDLYNSPLSIEQLQKVTRCRSLPRVSLRKSLLKSSHSSTVN